MGRSSPADLFLAQLGSNEPRAKYVTTTLYLPVRLAHEFRGVAADGGWELGDLARALILAGLAFTLLRVAKDELVSVTRQVYALGELTRLVTGTVRHPYQASIGSRRGSWITARLPGGFLKFLSMYARSTDRSRNGTVNLFLRTGLLLYLAGYNKFLRAIIDARESGLAGSGGIPQGSSAKLPR